jgi:hypothetical protein
MILTAEAGFAILADAVAQRATPGSESSGEVIPSQRWDDAMWFETWNSYRRTLSPVTVQSYQPQTLTEGSGVIGQPDSTREATGRKKSAFRP